MQTLRGRDAIRSGDHLAGQNNWKSDQPAACIGGARLGQALGTRTRVAAVHRQGKAVTKTIRAFPPNLLHWTAETGDPDRPVRRPQHMIERAWTLVQPLVDALRGYNLITRNRAGLCVPKRNPIVLASAMIEPHHTSANNNEYDMNHEVIHRIEKNQGV